jgi:hypothetical protein
MHARLVEFSGADPEKRDAAKERMRETVIPMLQTYDGFVGFIGLHDTDNRAARAILLWESKEAAETAEETLAERRKQLASDVGLTVESANLYEVLALNLERVPAQV